MLARTYLEVKGMAKNWIITWAAKSPNQNPRDKVLTTHNKTSVSCWSALDNSGGTMGSHKRCLCNLRASRNTKPHIDYV